jgi:hypothetical protein
MWLSYESLGDCVGEQASGCVCIYARVGEWQSGRIRLGVDEGWVGKRAEILSIGCRNVETKSHVSKENNYVTTVVIGTESVSYNYRLPSS